ncbi:Zn(II)2Cys6 transcription factor [Phanerochaete sordida]|uniref:Zn(II)2Cys6 transcription factor n=1 Tax=Phanerochaete sordida TaxID=48140 RepID=A0A9P3G6E3_9APHY|nr:Zn(II)2Cys6 transcription factor [Phanerochaete sordida]
MDQPGTSQASPPTPSTGFNFSTPSIQNQIHELAKTLPPPRKQNTACDACRSRKVKCNQLPGQDKCQHCQAKNYPCTHFVQQATSEKKRNTNKRPRTLSNGSHASTGPIRTDASASARVHPYPPIAVTAQSPQQQERITLETPTRDLIAYLFSPPDPSDRAMSPMSRPSNMRVPRAGSESYEAYAEWGELADQLQSEKFRTEFTLDLVEVFFQIVHTRLPLLNPAQFRARLQYGLQTRDHYSPPSPDANGFSPGPGSHNKPLHNALVATVVAWGAKFSEHPLLVKDRERNRGQSMLAKTLINRTRDLAEDLKVHRVPNADHVVVALLIEPMQNQNPEDSNGFHGFWLFSAIRLLLDLQINHKSVMSNIEDSEARGTMIFAWWMACLSDAYRSVYYRRKPMLDDDDYDIDFYTVGPVPPAGSADSAPSPSVREQLEFLGYYRSAHALARIARQMSRQLWRPATESDGIPMDVLLNLITLLNEWKDEHLSRVGVPSNFAAEWDFVSAVSACASDATYHIMWIIIFNALDDFGIREVNDVVRTGSPGHEHPSYAQIEAIKKKVSDDALHGALRIAGLAGVLSSNGYLRLDCAVMHVSIIQAGTLLARLGRPEVENCIKGLQQYAYAYEECMEQANDIQRLYTQAVAGDFDLNHMATVLRPGQAQDGSLPLPDTTMTMPFTHDAMAFRG